MDNEKCCTKKSNLTCPITGFCLCPDKRFIKCFILMLVWINVFSWFWHTAIMGEMYTATASLWRGPTEMIVWSLNLGLGILAFFSTYIFLKGYEGAGWREGLRFGIIVTLLFSGIGFITYATQPMPQQISLYWLLGDFLMYSVGGILLSFLAGKKGCCSSESESC